MTIPRLVPRTEAVSRIGAPRLPVATQTRRYRSLWADLSGDIQETEQEAPVHPLFDAAHSAFVRGTLILTPRGPVAIEDLLPGDKVVSAAHGPLAISWIGSMDLRPETQGNAPRLTRIMADAFGMGRPIADLMAGPGARLLGRPRQLRDRLGADHVLTPAHVMADGQTAFCVIPRQTVTLYHLCLRRHAVITANGLEVESYHPGAGFDRDCDAETLRRFLSLFPHIRKAQDFGPLAHLRLPLDTPDTLDVA